MNLLLFLSALLTGLTGAVSGAQQRAAPAVETSIARAIEIAAKAAKEVPASERYRLASDLRPIRAVRDARPIWALDHATPVIAFGQAGEKRLI